MTTGTILEAAAAGDPDRVALIIDGRCISYGELAQTVRQCAAGLTAQQMRWLLDYAAQQSSGITASAHPSRRRLTPWSC